MFDLSLLSPPEKRVSSHDIGRTKGSLNTELHAICDDEGCPLAMCLAAGQTFDHGGAKIFYPHCPMEAAAS
jgi:hypothetical protein